MLFRPVLTVAAFVISAGLASAAQPPACLLAAINTEPNPADLKTICGADASKVKGEINSACGNDASTALASFTSICEANGHTVASSTPTHSTLATATKITHASATGGGDAHHTRTVNATATIASGSVVTAQTTSVVTSGLLTASGAVPYPSGIVNGTMAVPTITMSEAPASSTFTGAAALPAPSGAMAYAQIAILAAAGLAAAF